MVFNYCLAVTLSQKCVYSTGNSGFIAVYLLGLALLHNGVSGMKVVSKMLS